MKALAAFYFSGTGNTRYICERLCKKLSSKYAAKQFDISSPQNFSLEIKGADLVLLAFPIYGSAPPIPMRRFVQTYRKELSGKRIVLAETQYFFSGDGAAAIGRTVQKFGGKIVGAEHFNMPNNLSDCKIFPIRNGKDLEKTLARAEKRMDAFAARILEGKISLRGFRMISHGVGYFCQRKFWRKKEAEKRKKLKILPDRCVGCGLCARNCPADNLTLENGKAVPLGKCVLCYRCVNLCPRKAISLIGSAPPEAQYRGLGKGGIK